MVRMTDPAAPARVHWDPPAVMEVKALFDMTKSNNLSSSNNKNCLIYNNSSSHLLKVRNHWIMQNWVCLIFLHFCRFYLPPFLAFFSTNKKIFSHPFHSYRYFANDWSATGKLVSKYVPFLAPIRLLATLHRGIEKLRNEEKRISSSTLCVCLSFFFKSLYFCQLINYA